MSQILDRTSFLFFFYHSDYRLASSANQSGVKLSFFFSSFDDDSFYLPTFVVFSQYIFDHFHLTFVLLESKRRPLFSMSIVATNLFRRFNQISSTVRHVHLSSCIYQERFFTKKHEWIEILSKSQKANEVRIGISDYAQKALGDVVYCELPAVGTKYKRDDSFATLESVKAVSDCYMPVDGEISGVNEKLKTEADLINKSPYENGWLVQAVIDEQQKKDLAKNLMSEKKYEEFLETNKEAADH